MMIFIYGNIAVNIQEIPQTIELPVHITDTIRSEELVKNVILRLDTEYNDTPGGLSGNDDAGQMSAWYITAIYE